jgi:putative effector of murein hydrolase
MIEFVQLWVYLSSTPLFGLTATLVVYLAAQSFYTLMEQAPWANPVLWSVMVLAILLTLTHTTYPAYFSGAQFIHFLLGPAVVSLAWPLWVRRVQLYARWGRFLLASLAGGATAALSAVALAWAMGLPHDVLMSLAPKSVTAPVAMGVAEKIGGIPALAAVFAVLTGMVGALSGKYIFDAIGIGRDAVGWMARGFSLGTAAHGIGAARALQVHTEAGAWAALALGLQVVLASVLVPLAAQFI